MAGPEDQVLKNQHNEKDPLKMGPFAAKELFERFSKAANGFPFEAAQDAAVNILINALRQQNSSRNEAEKSYNELFGKAKQLLLNHYDGAGNRRNVFPFHQIIEAPFLDFRKKDPAFRV